MAPSTKHRPTNSDPPSAAPHPTPVPILASTIPTSSTHTLQPTLNAPRPPVKKLVPSDTLGRYLSFEDRRDRSFMAILAAFSTVNNQALCVKELVDVIRGNQLLNLGGATPSGTINSAIRNHVNRCADRQLPCLLSRHVLSGDASDERLSPSIGVKPHHRRRAPPIVSSEPASPDATSSSSTTTFALHASGSLVGTASISASGAAVGVGVSPLSPTSPFSFSTSPTPSSPASPSPSAIFHSVIHQQHPQPEVQSPQASSSAQQPPRAEKIYLKNKNGRTRKGVCLWFLSPWTGFQNPFVREGFDNIGFLTDGKPVAEGDTYLDPSDFEFRWCLTAGGMSPSSSSFGTSGSGSGLKKGDAATSLPPPAGEMNGATSFFASPTPVPSLSMNASGAATSAALKLRKTSSPPSPPAAPSAPKTNANDGRVKGEPRDALSKATAPTTTISSTNNNGCRGGSPIRFLSPLQIPGCAGNPGAAGSASKGSAVIANENSRKQKRQQDQVKYNGDSSSLHATSVNASPRPSQPNFYLSSTASSTIDAASSDVEMDCSSDDGMSGSSGESDAAAESDSEKEQSEAATTVDPDEDNFVRFGNWGYDDEAEEEEDDDEDGTVLITPRSSVIDGSPRSHSIHASFTPALTNVKSAVHIADDIRAFPGWSDFPAASAAMTMELSVSFHSATSQTSAVGDDLPQVPPSARPPPLLLLNIPPAEHEAIPHDDLGSPFTPLSGSMSSGRASSPASTSAHQPVLDGLHMDLDVELSSQNGDTRRAAEDDILIDELLVGPEGALLHEFEEAWGDSRTGREQEDASRSTYPATPEPLEAPELPPADTRSVSPIPIASSYFRKRTYFTDNSTSPPRAPSEQQKHQLGTGTPGRNYCPGICVPMHRPASSEGIYAEPHDPTTRVCPSITISMPSTPPRTPSPSSQTAVQTPQAELDALIVPGAAVSESPTPASLLLPLESEFVTSSLTRPKVGPASSVAVCHTPLGVPPLAPLHLGSHQLGQIVINTIQPSNPPVCATFVDGVFVYTLTDPGTGQRLLRAVDTDYVHLSSLIAISHPPLSPRDACRIISLCQSPTIILPSTSPVGPGAAPTITPLAGSWVPLEDAHTLCYTGELNIPQAVGQLFLERNLGEQYFPEPLPEWCRARRHLHGPGMGLYTAMNNGGGLTAANANVSAMAALAELARMGGKSTTVPTTPPPAPTRVLTPTPETIPQLATPRSPTPPLAATQHPPSLQSMIQQQNQRNRPQRQYDKAAAPVVAPLSPALSAPSPPSSHVTMNSASNAPSLVRSVSATSVSSDSSALSSPPTTPPPEIPASASVSSESTERRPKKRGPGRPRKRALSGKGATPADDKKQQRARSVAATAPLTSRTERATARSLRSASGH